MLILVDMSSLSRANRARRNHIRELLRHLILHAEGADVALLGWPSPLGDPAGLLAPLPSQAEARLRVNVSDWDLAHALTAGETILYSPYGVPSPPERVRRALASCPWVATLPHGPARGVGRCARVIAWTRAGAERVLCRGVYPTQLRWIPPALEGSGSRLRRRRETVAVPPGPYVAMSWPGAPSSPRSHAEALRHVLAFRRARRAGTIPSPASLVVLGAPSLVRQACSWLDREPCVRWLDPLDEFERERIIGSAQTWLHSGLEPESLLETAEALRLGVPVLAPSRGELREVFGPAARYHAVADRDAMTAELGELLADDGLRRSLAQRGIARARAFTWEAFTRQLLDLFAELRRETRLRTPAPAAAVEAPGALALTRQ